MTNIDHLMEWLHQKTGDKFPSLKMDCCVESSNHCDDGKPFMSLTIDFPDGSYAWLEFDEIDHPIIEVEDKATGAYYMASKNHEWRNTQAKEPPSDSNSGC